MLHDVGILKVELPISKTGGRIDMPYRQLQDNLFSEASSDLLPSVVSRKAVCLWQSRNDVDRSRQSCHHRASMKCIPVVSSIAALSLAACDTMSGPITRGSYDPLLPAGSSSSNAPVQSVTAAFSAGQFVRASMNNTAFFKTRPSGDADADKLLRRGTSMKVISATSSYVKVELDSGEIGFVPSVMLEDPNAAPQVLKTNPGEYQVYPPLPGAGPDQPLPPLDPTGLPPEGAIPTVIDPDAPAESAPLPPVAPTTETFPAPVPPVEPKVESTPPAPPSPPAQQAPPTPQAPVESTPKVTEG